MSDQQKGPIHRVKLTSLELHRILEVLRANIQMGIKEHADPHTDLQPLYLLWRRLRYILEHGGQGRPPDPWLWPGANDYHERLESALEEEEQQVPAPAAPIPVRRTWTRFGPRRPRGAHPS